MISASPNGTARMLARDRTPRFEGLAGSQSGSHSWAIAVPYTRARTSAAGTPNSLRLSRSARARAAPSGSCIRCSSEPVSPCSGMIVRSMICPAAFGGTTETHHLASRVGVAGVGQNDSQRFPDPIGDQPLGEPPPEAIT